MEKAHRMIAGSLLLGGLVACEPVEPTAGVSMDARGVRGGVGASSGPVRADVGTGGAAVRARSGPVSVGMGTSGARAGIDVLDDEPPDLSFGLSRCIGIAVAR